TCVICSQFAVRGSQLTTANCSAAYRDLRTSSYKYPYEDDHSQKKHQRVIAHIAGLEEAQQIADCGHDVTDHRQQSVDESVDPAPEKLGELLQRRDDGPDVKLIDVPLVLHAAGDCRRSLCERLVCCEPSAVIARPREPGTERGDDRGHAHEQILVLN